MIISTNKMHGQPPFTACACIVALITGSLARQDSSHGRKFPCTLDPNQAEWSGKFGAPVACSARVDNAEPWYCPMTGAPTDSSVTPHRMAWSGCRTADPWLGRDERHGPHRTRPRTKLPARTGKHRLDLCLTGWIAPAG